jgi:trk system potassium uptake protein TrkH
MLYREIARIIGIYFSLFSVALLVPLGVSAYYEFTSASQEHPQPHVTDDFAFTLLLCLALASSLLWIGRGSKGILYRREGIAAVVFMWLLTPAISAIPFISSGTLSDPVQAYFEMVSGFTTTGATILHPKAYDSQGIEIPIVHTIPGVIDTTYHFYGTVDPVRDTEGNIIKEGIEAVGKALLFWRSFTQWLGGLGIVVLFVAILPALGIGGKVLFQSEISGPVKEGTTPRIKETAIQLWLIYLGLTLLQIVTLLLVDQKLPLFEAAVITFSTLSTGGLSTQNTSIAGYHSLGVEWVVILFMIAGGINFSLYYYLVRGKFYRLVNPEFILFWILLAVFCLGTVYAIHGAQETSLSGEKIGAFHWADAFRKGVFQLVSFLTSTGFSTTDYDIWPYTAQVLLLIAMFLGGMSGSTSGGMKTIRHYMLFRLAQNRVESLFRPDHVKILKIGNREVDYAAATTVFSFFLIVISMATLGTLLYIYDGIDPETALGLTACTLNNTGASFRMAGPLHSCAFLSDFSLILSSLMMICGRLEYYAILAMLVPAFWRQDS